MVYIDYKNNSGIKDQQYTFISTIENYDGDYVDNNLEWKKDRERDVAKARGESVLFLFYDTK